MMEQARVAHYQSGWQATTVTPDEYQMLYGKGANNSNIRNSSGKKLRRRWRFKPKTGVTFLCWAFLLFVMFRLLLIPMAEGIYNYFVKTQEIGELQNQYRVMSEQLKDLNKNLTYMHSKAYLEEQAHQLGYIKPNESQMMVVESTGNTQIFQPSKKPVNGVTY